MDGIRITTPLTRDVVMSLRAGDTVLLSGTVYTARDAAHARLVKLLSEGADLPLRLDDAAIYYAGPTPAKPGEAIGSCGPTTSGRMDIYTPPLLRHGLKAMLGKGPRGNAVIDAMVEAGAVYFAAAGGAGALMASCILSCETVCYEDLGSEAICRLNVKDMPLTVAVDAMGGDLYKDGPARYLSSDIYAGDGRESQSPGTPEQNKS